MTNLVDIRPDHLRIVQDVLRDHLPAGIRVWVFGSRAQWSAREGSDLDLALEGERKLDRKVIAALTDALEDSDLPYTVDVVDLNRISKQFRQIVDSHKVSLSLGTGRDEVTEWTTMPFSEAVTVNPPVRLEHGSCYPFVDMAAVNPGSRWSYAVAQRKFSGGGSRFQHGDTLMARITPCLENGKVARYRSIDDLNVAHGSTEFIVIRGRPDVTDDDFAYYLTQSPEVRSHAISQMTGTSGRQRVPVSALDHVDVPVPPLPEQRAIAHVLGTLDDKIELNRRMNGTLEEMARALFRSWFVDFDPVRTKMDGRWQRGESLPGLPAGLYDLLPERMVPSELGQIPKGWSVKTLGDIAVSSNRTVSPAEVAPKTPYIGLQQMPRRSLALTQWESAGQVTSNKVVFRQGALLFGKLRPYFHKVGVAPVAGIASTDIVVVEPIAPDWSGLAACHLSSDEFVAYTDRTSTGTRMPRTSWPVMKQYTICLPSEAAAREFQKIVGPLLDHVVQNCNASHALHALQKALLPKLISGEVQINDLRDEHVEPKDLSN